MTANGRHLSVETLEIRKEIEIAAPIAVAFDAVLEQMGAGGEMPDGKPFPMTLELWPGGRWFRDLGDNAGHFWGHVQVVKPPKLLEIYGPLMMSYPAANHLQYRLTEEAEVTKLSLTHRAVGVIEVEHREGLALGWEYWLQRMRKLAEAAAKRGATK